MCALQICWAGAGRHLYARNRYTSPFRYHDARMRRHDASTDTILSVGTSFVITKKGLNDATERHGFEGEGFTYLKSPIWWGGIVTSTIHRSSCQDRSSYTRSGLGRDCQLCSICICASDFSDTIGCSQCADRVCLDSLEEKDWV